MTIVSFFFCCTLHFFQNELVIIVVTLYDEVRNGESLSVHLSKKYPQMKLVWVSILND
jgi:hypothetical protein